MLEGIADLGIKQTHAGNHNNSDNVSIKVDHIWDVRTSRNACSDKATVDKSRLSVDKCL